MANPYNPPPFDDGAAFGKRLLICGVGAIVFFLPLVWFIGSFVREPLLFVVDVGLGNVLGIAASLVAFWWTMRSWDRYDRKHGI